MKRFTTRVVFRQDQEQADTRPPEAKPPRRGAGGPSSFGGHVRPIVTELYQREGRVQIVLQAYYYAHEQRPGQSLVKWRRDLSVPCASTDASWLDVATALEAAAALLRDSLSVDEGGG